MLQDLFSKYCLCKISNIESINSARIFFSYKKKEINLFIDSIRPKKCNISTKLMNKTVETIKIFEANYNIVKNPKKLSECPLPMEFLPFFIHNY